MRDHIFISYRRDDARGASGRLFDWLRIAFGSDRVFRDVHSIGVGLWRNKIDLALARTAVCVVVVGNRWASEENLRRLHDEADMVRHELVSALAAVGQGVLIVPTLVENSSQPATDNLPPSLRTIFQDWNVRKVTEDGWEDDTRRLIAELAKASGLAVGDDVEVLLRDAGLASERIAALESEKRLQVDQIAALQSSVRDLTRQVAESTGSNERHGLACALAALARGDTLAAEDAFEDEYESRQATENSERIAKADAARNVGNLAMLRDVRKAVCFYRRALEAQPAHAETAKLLGSALQLLGDLDGASQAFATAIQLAKLQLDARIQWSATTGNGDVLEARGDLEGALRTYRDAAAVAEECVTLSPEDTEWQRNIAVSQERISGSLLRVGDVKGALRALRVGLAALQKLTALEPSNSLWHRDLVVFHRKLGVILFDQNHPADALVELRSGLAVAERFSNFDPANTSWKRSLALLYRSIGEALIKQGNTSCALVEFHCAHVISQQLAAADPANTHWQHDLAISHNRKGSLCLRSGELIHAMEQFRSSLTIYEGLAALDQGDTRWQSGLMASHSHVGDLLLREEDFAGALAAFSAGMAIAISLTDQDPLNTSWQRSLSIVHERIGDALLGQGKTTDALESYRRGMAIAETLTKLDPANAQWRSDLTVSKRNIADALSWRPSRNRQVREDRDTTERRASPQ